MRKFIKRYLPDHETVLRNPWLRPFENSLLHPRLWHLNRHTAAGAVAAGLACGLIPGPLQMIGAAVCALVFRVNLPLAVLVTLYTNPLTIVPLYLLAYQLGRYLLGEHAGWLAPPMFDPWQIAAWTKALEAWMRQVAEPLGVGLLGLALGLALTGYVLVKAGWRCYLLRAWRQRTLRS